MEKLHNMRSYCKTVEMFEDAGSLHPWFYDRNCYDILIAGIAKYIGNPDLAQEIYHLVRNKLEPIEKPSDGGARGHISAIDGAREYLYAALYTKQHLKTDKDLGTYKDNLALAKEMLRNQYMHEFDMVVERATQHMQKDCAKLENIIASDSMIKGMTKASRSR